jgi:hypothetical protein
VDKLPHVEAGGQPDRRTRTTLNEKKKRKERSTFWKMCEEPSTKEYETLTKETLPWKGKGRKGKMRFVKYKMRRVLPPTFTLRPPLNHRADIKHEVVMGGGRVLQQEQPFDVCVPNSRAMPQGTRMELLRDKRRNTT